VQERLSAEPHTRLRFFCSAAGFRRDDTSEQRLEKLADLMHADV
jgi:hypothetical protein